MSDRILTLLGVWAVGLLLLLVLWATASALLRYTRAGRAQGLQQGELVKVLAVCLGLCCAVLSVLVLVI